MRHRITALAVLAGAIAATASFAQNATPRTRTNVVVASEPAKVTLSMRGTQTYLAVDAKGADVRATLKDMATKAGAKLVLDPSAIGIVTGSVDAQPADAAIAAVAKLATLSVEKIVVPDAAAATLTADLGGRYSEALTSLTPGTLISDPTTGKTLVVTAAAPAQFAGSAVYFVHGRLAPGGMRMRQPRNGANGANGGPGGPGGPGANGGPGGPGGMQQPSQANQAIVDATAKSLAQLPVQQRMDTLRALQMQMFQSMTDAERAQLGGGRGFGRGGFGGGRAGGGRGNNGGGGNAGADNGNG